MDDFTVEYLLFYGLLLVLVLDVEQVINEVLISGSLLLFFLLLAKVRACQSYCPVEPVEDIIFEAAPEILLEFHSRLDSVAPCNEIVYSEPELAPVFRLS